jgi:hypothetical protein
MIVQLISLASVYYWCACFTLTVLHFGTRFVVCWWLDPAVARIRPNHCVHIGKPLAPVPVFIPSHLISSLWHIIIQANLPIYSTLKLQEWILLLIFSNQDFIKIPRFLTAYCMSRPSHSGLNSPYNRPIKCRAKFLKLLIMHFSLLQFGITYPKSQTLWNPKVSFDSQDAMSGRLWEGSHLM